MREPASTYQLPSDVDRVIISMNPKSGATDVSDRIERLADLISAAGYLPEILTDLDQVSEKAAQYHQEGRLRALVGSGGDGTAAEMFNRAPRGTPLCIYPAGNENLLARYLGLEKSPSQIAKLVIDGQVARYDAVRADSRLFLLMIGVGFDAEVCRRLEEWRTGHVRSRHYIKPICSTLRKYKYPPIRVVSDELPEGEITVHWAFAFNFPCYGGGFRIAPNADPSCGKLDLCTFNRSGRVSTLFFATSVLMRRHEKLSGCENVKIGKFRLESDGEVPYQLDGDFRGFLPVEIEIMPQVLNIIAPLGQSG